jgi:SWI/SNF-related matrix-associated actin-dependent regulator 1 of chromatin subfamily A
VKKILKPFQQQGANFLASQNYALLADEMGLGKTVTALAATEAVGSVKTLVVCPASVRSNWKQEITECGMVSSRFNVVSYNQAVAGVPGSWQNLILDEAHFLKTPESQRTQAIFGNTNGLARRAQRVWALTGTPVLNRPRELYPILKTMAPALISPYTTWDKFTRRYCGAYWEGPGRGMNTRGASNIGELRSRISPFMLRREKKDVLPELPPRIISRPPLELTEKELEPILNLENEMGNRETYLSPTYEDYAQLGDMAKMLKAVGLAKVPKVVSFVEDLLETLGDEGKVVIFAWHRDAIKALDDALGHHLPAVYVGGMSDEKKTAAVNTFRKDGRCSVFIGQIAAAGTGINGLQEVCSDVVFAEMSWVPGAMSQAIDRCHRIGQTASVVNVYMPHVPGTLESAMLQVHMGKEAVIDALVGVRGGAEENVLEGLV